MTGDEWAAEEYRALLATQIRKVRDQHDPECACGADEALSEPIKQGEE